MAEVFDVEVQRVEDNITARIPSKRAVAELSRLSEPYIGDIALPPGNWLWFNRLINQTGERGIGTQLLDAVLHYCRVRGYSILNQVNAYGTVPQKELEAWYICKGFEPLDKKKFGNSVLIWRPHV